jgi:hypothetical protein
MVCKEKYSENEGIRWNRNMKKNRKKWCDSSVDYFILLIVFNSDPRNIAIDGTKFSSLIVVRCFCLWFCDLLIERGREGGRKRI